MASQAENCKRAYFFTDYMDLKGAHDVYVYENRQYGTSTYTLVVLRSGGISTIDRPFIDAKAVYDKEGFNPFAITFSKDKFYVTDKRSIRLFNTAFKLQKDYAVDELNSPTGIYASDTRLYVMNGKNNSPDHPTAIFVFDLAIENKSKFAIGAFVDPWSLKVNLTEELIFVSDSSQVKIFDNNTGILFHSIDIPEYKDGQKMLCRGLDIDENDNVFVALRVEGLRRQYECIQMFTKTSHYEKGHDIFEGLPSLGPATGYFSTMKTLYSIKEDAMNLFNKFSFGMLQNKKFHFVRGIHYKNMNGKHVLFATDAGNDCIRMLYFDELTLDVP